MRYYILITFARLCLALAAFCRLLSRLFGEQPTQSATAIGKNNTISQKYGPPPTGGSSVVKTHHVQKHCKYCGTIKSRTTDRCTGCGA